jgi:predicted 3-demethylubiquinone-9 3-methyltransferase (glyoxalase superfamily)
MSALQHFPRVTPFLWFDANAEEAVDFYITIFKNSRRLDELRNPAEAPVPKGSVLTLSF